MGYNKEGRREGGEEGRRQVKVTTLFDADLVVSLPRMHPVLKGSTI
jgi:hypothetical protein